MSLMGVPFGSYGPAEHPDYYAEEGATCPECGEDVEVVATPEDEWEQCSSTSCWWRSWAHLPHCDGDGDDW